MTDQEFISELVALRPELIRRVVGSFRQSYDDAEDIVGETFFKAIRYRRRFDGRKLRAWVHTILRNTMINRTRGDMFKQRNLESFCMDYELDNFSDGSYHDGISDELSEALDALPVEFSTAIVLWKFEGLSYEEIARITDVPTGTVRSRIHRGRKQLFNDVKLKRYFIKNYAGSSRAL